MRTSFFSTFHCCHLFLSHRSHLKPFIYFILFHSIPETLLKWTKWENLNKFLCKFYRFSSNFFSHSSSIHTQIEKYHLRWLDFMSLWCARCYFLFYHIKRMITINRLSWSLKHEITSSREVKLWTFELYNNNFGD